MFVFLLSGGTMLNQLSQCANIYLANTSYAGCSIQLSVRNILSHWHLTRWADFLRLLCSCHHACWMLTLAEFSTLKFFINFLTAEYRVWCNSDITTHNGWLLHGLLSICAMYTKNQRKCAGKYWRFGSRYEIDVTRSSSEPNRSLLSCSHEQILPVLNSNRWFFSFFPRLSFLKIDNCLLENIARNLTSQQDRVNFYTNITSCVLARARCNSYNPITGELQSPNRYSAFLPNAGYLSNALQIAPNGDLRIFSYQSQQLGVSSTFCSTKSTLDQAGYGVTTC